MRAVVQRVSSASVEVEGERVTEIGPGLLVLVAAHKEDTRESAVRMASRVANLRIFNDEAGKMNLALPEGGQVLVVSNFTVYADTSQRRPSLIEAASYQRGRWFLEEFVEELRRLKVRTECGVYGADMKVALVNDGPVTVILET